MAVIADPLLALAFYFCRLHFAFDLLFPALLLRFAFCTLPFD